jgi:transcriptional regulator with XRE-family HTH domain
MTDAEVFGQVLREHRLKRGHSQESLALETGYHRTYISQLERGIKSPSLTTILRLSDILRVKASELIDRVEARTRKVHDRVGVK